MPRIGRRTNPEPWVNWKLIIPAALAGTVEHYLFDTTHGKPAYASRATLVNRLLQEWVDRLPPAYRVEGGGLIYLKETSPAVREPEARADA